MTSLAVIVSKPMAVDYFEAAKNLPGQIRESHDDPPLSVGRGLQIVNLKTG